MAKSLKKYAFINLHRVGFMLAFAAVVLPTLAVAADEPLTVMIRAVEDRKAVFATVESVDVVTARTRIGGTVAALSVDEGSMVKKGQQIAMISDPKLSLKIRAVRAQVDSLRSQLELAQTEFRRAEKLLASGTIAQVRLDEATTKLDIVSQSLTQARAELAVIEQQQNEGAVLAPAEGRVLKVQVSNGAVVLPGETVASLAAEAYILRLQLPERHAQFARVGDRVMVTERGMANLRPTSDEYMRIGYIRQVYPEIKQGRVAVDVEVEGLGDFFVGERTRVYINTGMRMTYVIPPQFLYQRYGLSYVRLADGAEVVVQPGLPLGEGVEILSGVREGDILILPESKK